MSDKETREKASIEQLRAQLEKANARQKRAAARRGVDVDEPGGCFTGVTCVCTIAVLGFVVVVMGTCIAG